MEPIIIELELEIMPSRLLDPAYRESKIKKLVELFDSLAAEYEIELTPEVREAAAKLMRDYESIAKLRKEAEKAAHEQRSRAYEQRRAEEIRQQREDDRRKRQKELDRAQRKREQEEKWAKQQDSDVEEYRKALGDPDSEHYAYVAAMPYKLGDADVVAYLRGMPWLGTSDQQINNDEDLFVRFLREVIETTTLIEVPSIGGFVGKDARDTIPEKRLGLTK